MHAYFVLAHPEPRSFSAALVSVAVDELAARSWTTTTSDLYAMMFDLGERASHHPAAADAGPIDVQAAQRTASEAGALPAVLVEELARLDRADLLVLQ